LEDNGTWAISDSPLDQKALGCKWVYKVKYNFDGPVQCYKAQLLIFGNQQDEGIDFTKTFAPVERMVTV